MTLKLLLVEDNRVIFEITLSPSDWSKSDLENELEAFEENFKRYTRIFDALAHETRLKMMTSLLEMENHTMNFTDFMRELDLNPKIVWENARKLRESGFVTKVDRGRYKVTEFGQRRFMMVSLALRRLLKSLEDME